MNFIFFVSQNTLCIDLRADFFFFFYCNEGVVFWAAEQNNNESHVADFFFAVCHMEVVIYMRGIWSLRTTPRPQSTVEL